MQTPDGGAARQPMKRTEEVFTLRKGDWVAVCDLTCHGSQHHRTWLLRLFVGTPDNELIAAYCDSHREVSSLSETWKGKLIAHGWSPRGRENIRH